MKYTTCILIAMLTAVNAYADLGWFTAFENDSDGTVITGSVAALAEAVESGADIKAIRVESSGDEFTSALLDWVEVRLDQSSNPVVSGAFKKISLSHNSDGTNSPTSNAYYMNIVLNTTGDVFYARYYMNGSHYSDSSTSWRIKWLVKY